MEVSTYQLADEAVFRRTKLGQDELACPSGDLSKTQRIVLATVTGYTQLRVVIDLAGSATGMKEAIEGLVQKRLIEQVESERQRSIAVVVITAQ